MAKNKALELTVRIAGQVDKSLLASVRQTNSMLGTLTSATATVTPAAVENYFNIFVSAIVEVPRGCCLTVAMENTSTQAINFANSNLTVDRVS